MSPATGSVSKRSVIEAFIAQFERELGTSELSARAAHEAATNPESKSEDKHDTRGVEASYLAGAQAARAAELKKIILEYKRLLDSADRASEKVETGALLVVQPLVEGEPKGAKLHQFVAPWGGGATVQIGGKSISVLSPTSPLGSASLGAGVGEEVEIETQGGERSYLIESIQ